MFFCFDDRIFIPPVPLDLTRPFLGKNLQKLVEFIVETPVRLFYAVVKGVPLTCPPVR